MNFGFPSPAFLLYIKHMKKRRDFIDYKTIPHGLHSSPYPNLTRAIITINGRSILDIAREAEMTILPNCTEAGQYHYMLTPELYESLTDAELSGEEQEVPVLCCVCDDVRCKSFHVTIQKREDTVIWKNIGNSDGYQTSLSFSFELKNYEDFMKKLQKETEYIETTKEETLPPHI